MCETALKLSNRGEVPGKECQVVAENFAPNPTIQKSYETITSRRKTAKQKTKSSRGNGHSAVKTETH